MLTVGKRNRSTSDSGVASRSRSARAPAPSAASSRRGRRSCRARRRVRARAGPARSRRSHARTPSPARRTVTRGLLPLPVRIGQGLAIDFAVRRERERVEPGERARHHVARQPAAQVLLERGDQLSAIGLGLMHVVAQRARRRSRGGRGRRAARRARRREGRVVFPGFAAGGRAQIDVPARSGGGNQVCRIEAVLRADRI